MKKTLALEDYTARSLYKIADSNFKTILEDTFGIDFFVTKLSDRIKTLGNVYNELNQIPLKISDYLFLLEKDREQSLYIQYQLDIIKCFNQGWKPDFTNIHEHKYYLWWERKRTGWLLGGVGICQYGNSALGAGFYFKNREDAAFCATQFKEIFTKTFYNDEYIRR